MKIIGRAPENTDVLARLIRDERMDEAFEYLKTIHITIRPNKRCTCIRDKTILQLLLDGTHRFRDVEFLIYFLTFRFQHEQYMILQDVPSVSIPFYEPYATMEACRYRVHTRIDMLDVILQDPRVQQYETKTSSDLANTEFLNRIHSLEVLERALWHTKITSALHIDLGVISRPGFYESQVPEIAKVQPMKATLMAEFYVSPSNFRKRVGKKYGYYAKYAAQVFVLILCIESGYFI